MYVGFLLFLFCQGIVSNQCSYKIGRGLAQTEIAVVVHHFVTKTIRGRLDPPTTPLLFPKSSDQNFETAIMINTVVKSSIHAFGDDQALQIPGERL